MHDLHDDPEQGLRAAEARRRQARTEGDWENYRIAHQDVLRLERQLAAGKGEEYAEPCDFPLKWDVGAPLPHLLTNDNRALLAFAVLDQDPTYERGEQQLGLVEFEGCLSAKLGTPSDEVFQGHPLYRKGLEACSAQRVVNSRWLRELEAISSVHSRHRPERFRGLTHYVFWFKDSTFECVAGAFTVTTRRTSMTALLGVMVERLMS